MVSVPVATAYLVPYVVTSTSYSTTEIPYLLVHTQTVTYTTSSTTSVPITQQQTTSSQVWSVSQTTLGCNKYVVQGASLSTGWDVQVSWSASDTVDVYVFDSTQYSAYASSGTTSPNIASQSGAPASGKLGFHVSFSDTYYLVFHNLHNGFLCIGAENLAIYSGTGTATYQIPVTTYVTQVVTYTTSSQTLVTQTLTSTSVSTAYIPQTFTSTTTHTCSYDFWTWLIGSKACP